MLSIVNIFGGSVHAVKEVKESVVVACKEIALEMLIKVCT